MPALSLRLGKTTFVRWHNAHPEVLLTERRLGDVQVLWAVNDAAVPLDPGHLWRVSLAIGSRQPVLTEIDWPAAPTAMSTSCFPGKKWIAATPCRLTCATLLPESLWRFPKQISPVRSRNACP